MRASESTKILSSYLSHNYIILQAQDRLNKKCQFSSTRLYIIIVVRFVNITNIFQIKNIIFYSR
jgi:hypothetical protein